MGNTLKPFLFSAFLVLCAFAAGFAQPTSRPHQQFTDIRGVDTIFAKKQIIIRDAAKDTVEICGFKNGKKHGVQKLFYGNGDVRVIAKYKNNLLHGEVRVFQQGNTNPLKIEKYKAIPSENRSVLHGKSKTYNFSGTLTEMVRYKNGRKNGKYVFYHNSGNIKEKGKYKDDLNIGRKRMYNNDGNLSRDENYILIDNPRYVEAKSRQTSKNGKPLREDISVITKKISVLHGKVTYYFGNGQVFSELRFVEGKKEGMCKEYYQAKGNPLKSAIMYKNDQPHGSFERYRANGNPENRGVFYQIIHANDTVYRNVFDGEVVYYQDNGKRQRMENWKNFRKNGRYEQYYHRTGELSERSYFVDDLKSGMEERFDKEGRKTYEVMYETVDTEKGRVSQKTGPETYWKDGKITQTVIWKNGKREGVAMSYFPDGQLEKLMTFSEDKLNGPYQTYYPNGQQREDYLYSQSPKSSNHVFVGWNSRYDEDGNLTTRFFGRGDGKNILEQAFENGRPKSLSVVNYFHIEYSPDEKLNSIRWLYHSHPYFGFDFFTNAQLRGIHFKAVEDPSFKANFLTNGKINQIIGLTGKIETDEKWISVGEEVAGQYNADWANLPVISNTASGGNALYRWNFADGSPFFKIQFKDSLPHGEWIVFNPILEDTIWYGEFQLGLPVGKWLRKRMDGEPEWRAEYHPNHNLKEEYIFNQILSSVKKRDTEGKEIFFEDYFPNGQLRGRREPELGSFLNFNERGDTLNYSLLFTQGDSIRIRRQFYDENRVRVDRVQNLTTGAGSVSTYFENGQLQTRHAQINGESHGVYEKYDENGTLLTRGHFKEGKRHGKWITYSPDGTEEVSTFENGEIVIPNSEDDENLCRCYDKTLPSGKIGFANSLAYFAEFPKIQSYIPKTIHPIDDWHYDKIFYLNLRTNNDRNSGYTNFKIMPLRGLAFHYPTKKHLKFNLTPCQTEGYNNNFETTFHYSYRSKSLVNATLQPKRISVRLENNPLEAAEGDVGFEAFFDVEYLRVNANGIEEITYPKERNDCFVKAKINGFFEVDVKQANLIIDPNKIFYTGDVPMLPNEKRAFYGFQITEAELQFPCTIEGNRFFIQAKSENIFAGNNFIAASISVAGDSLTEDTFRLEKDKRVVRLSELQMLFEKQGFYRVEVTAQENILKIRFYAEN
ncbi:MAG: hypothetical protein JJU02_10655 [Cryomorphaceae bacterium]|nr:hypothetical protein [Cryomorphaceae bacterium]